MPQLPAPQNVSTQYAIDTLILSWDAIENIDGLRYQVVIQDVNGLLILSRPNLSTPQVSITHNELPAGNYQYQVLATAPNYDGSQTDLTALTVNQLMPIMGVTQTYMDITGIQIKWKVAPFATSYQYTLTNDATNIVVANNNNLNTTSVDVPANVLSDGTYTLALTAVSPNAYASHISSSLTIHVLNPVAPVTLSYSEDVAIFQWQPPSQNVLQIQYQFILKDNTDSIIASQSGLVVPAYTVTASTLTNTNYTVQIIATTPQAVGASNDPQTISIQKLAPPTELTMSYVGDELLFSWTPPVTNDPMLVLHYRFTLQTQSGSVNIDRPYLALPKILIPSQAIPETGDYIVTISVATPTYLGTSTTPQTITIETIQPDETPTLNMSIQGDQAIFTLSQSIDEPYVLYFFTLQDANNELTVYQSGLTIPQATVDGQLLQSGHTYTAKLGASTNNQLGKTLAETSVTITKLDPPANLAMQYNGNNLTFSWDTVAGNNVTYLFTLTHETEVLDVVHYGLKEPTISIDGRSLPSSTYTATVYATADDQLGATSDPLAIQLQRLNPPENLVAVPSGYQLLVMWDTIQSSDVTYFVAVRNSQNHVVSYHPDLSLPIAGIDSHVLNSGQYTVQVGATAANALGVLGEEVSITIDKLSAPSTPTLTYSDDRVQISWPASTDPDPRYQFILRSAQSKRVIVDQIGLTTPTLVLEGSVLTETEYTLQLGVVALGKLGSLSDEIPITINKLEPILTPAVTYNETAVTIAWTDPNSHTDTYEVTLTDATEQIVYQADALTQPQFTLTDHDLAGGEYTLAIRTHAPDALRSAWTTNTLTIPKLTAPDEITASYNQLTWQLSWTPATGASDITYHLIVTDATDQEISNQPNLTSANATIDSLLLASGAYTVRVTAVSPNALGQSHIQLFNINKLSTITSVNAVDGASQVTFRWDSVGIIGATYNATLKDSTEQIVAAQNDLTTPQWQVNNDIAPIGEYTIQVQAIHPDYLGSDSGWLSVTVSPYAPPQFLTWQYQIGTDATASLVVSWQGLQSDPQYNVTITNANDNTESYSQTVRGSMSATFEQGLYLTPEEPAKTFSIQVTTSDEQGTHASNPAEQTAVLSNPDIPPNLTMTFDGQNITLSWERVGSWAYEAELRQDAGQPIPIAETTNETILTRDVSELGLDFESNPQITLTGAVRLKSDTLLGPWGTSAPVSVEENQLLHQLKQHFDDYANANNGQTALNQDTLFNEFNPALNNDLSAFLQEKLGTSEIVLQSGNTRLLNAHATSLTVNGTAVAASDLLNDTEGMQVTAVFTAPNQQTLAMTLSISFPSTNWSLGKSYPDLDNSLLDRFTFIVGPTITLDSTNNCYLFQGEADWRYINLPLDALNLARPDSTTTLTGAITSDPTHPNFDLSTAVIYSQNNDLVRTVNIDAQGANLPAMTEAVMHFISTYTSEPEFRDTYAVLQGQMGVNGNGTAVYLRYPTLYTGWQFGLAEGASLTLTDVLSMIGATSISQILPDSLNTILNSVAITQFNMAFYPGEDAPTSIHLRIETTETWTIVPNSLAINNVAAEFEIQHYPASENINSRTIIDTLLVGTFAFGQSIAPIQVSVKIPSNGLGQWEFAITQDTETTSESDLPTVASLAGLVTNLNQVESGLPSVVQSGFEGLFIRMLTVGFQPTATPATLDYVYFSVAYNQSVTFVENYVTLENAAITINVDDPLNQNNSWALWWAVAGSATFFPGQASEIQMLLYVVSPDEEQSQTYLLGLEFAGFNLPNLGDFLALFGVPAGSIPDGIAETGGFAIQSMAFEVNQNNYNLDNFSFFLSSYNKWEIIPDYFIVNKMSIGTLTQIAGGVAVTGQIIGAINIVGTDVAIVAQRYSPTDNWQLVVNTEGDPVHIPGINDLANWVSGNDPDVYTEFLPPDAPFATGIDMPELDVKFDLSNGRFIQLAFALTTPNDWVILNENLLVIKQGSGVRFVISNDENNVRQISSASIRGELDILTAHFEVSATQEANSQEGWHLHGALAEAQDINLAGISNYFGYDSNQLPLDLTNLNFTLAQLQVDYWPDDDKFNFLAQATNTADSWSFQIINVDLQITKLGVVFQRAPIEAGSSDMRNIYGITGAFQIAHSNDINILFALSQARHEVEAVLLQATYADSLNITDLIIAVMGYANEDALKQDLGINIPIPTITISKFNLELYSEDNNQYFAASMDVSGIGVFFLAQNNSNAGWGFAVGASVDSSTLDLGPDVMDLLADLGITDINIQASLSTFSSNSDVIALPKQPFVAEGENRNSLLPFEQNPALNKVQSIQHGFTLFAQITFANADPTGAAAITQIPNLFPIQFPTGFLVTLNITDWEHLDLKGEIIGDFAVFVGEGTENNYLMLSDVYLDMKLDGTAVTVKANGMLTIKFGDYDPIIIDGYFAIDSQAEAAQFGFLPAMQSNYVDFGVIYEWDEPLGIPGLAIRLDEFDININFEEGLGELNIGGGLTVGQGEDAISGDVCLAISPETDFIPTYFTLNINNLMLDSIIRTFLGVDPDDYLKNYAGALHIGFRELMIHYNLEPSVNEPYTDIAFEGWMQIWNFDAYISFEARIYISEESPQAPQLRIDGFMDKLQWPLESNDPFIILSGYTEQDFQGEQCGDCIPAGYPLPFSSSPPQNPLTQPTNPQMTQPCWNNAPTRPNVDPSEVGPWISLATYTDETNNIVPHFGLSLRLRFFTVDFNICALIEANYVQFCLNERIAIGSGFDAQFDLIFKFSDDNAVASNTDGNPLVSEIISQVAPATSKYLYAHGSFQLHLDVQLDINSSIADSLRVTTDFNADATFNFNGSSSYVEFNSNLNLVAQIDDDSCTILIPVAIHLDLSSDFLDELYSAIIDNLTNICQGFFNALIDPSCWAVAVKAGLILVENIAEIVAGPFALVGEAAVDLFKTAGGILDDLGDALEDLFGISDPQIASDVMQVVGYVPSAVSYILDTVFGKDHHEQQEIIQQSFHTDDIEISSISFADQRVSVAWRWAHNEQNDTKFNLSILDASGKIVGTPKEGLTHMSDSIGLPYEAAGGTFTVALSIGVKPSGSKKRTYYLQTKPFEIPANIAGLTLTYDAHTLNANWNAVSGATYDLVLSTDIQTLESKAAQTNNSYSYALSNNQAGATYHLKVRVSDNGNWAEESLSVAPNVSGLVLTYNEPTLQATWQSSGQEVTYTITITGDDGSQVTQSNISGLTYSTELTNSSGVTYTVSVSPTVGNETTSSIHIPPQVTGLQPHYDNGLASLIWTDLNEGNAQTYTYDVRITQKNGQPIVQGLFGLGVAEAQTAVSDEWNGHTYHAQVRATQDGIAGNWSTADLTIPPDVVGLRLSFQDPIMQAVWTDINHPPEGIEPPATPFDFAFTLTNESNEAIGIVQPRDPQDPNANVNITATGGATYTGQARTISDDFKGNWVQQSITLPIDVTRVTAVYANNNIHVTWDDLNSTTPPTPFTYDCQFVDGSLALMAPALSDLATTSADFPAPSELAGHNYTIRVRANQNGVRGRWITAALTIPSNITALALNYDAHTLTATWDDLNDSTPPTYTYTAQLLDASNQIPIGEPQAGLSTATASFTLTDEQANHAYTVQIKTVLNGVHGNWQTADIFIPPNIQTLTAHYAEHVLTANWQDVNALLPPEIPPFTYDVALLRIPTNQNDPEELAVPAQNGLTSNSYSQPLDDSFGGAEYDIKVRATRNNVAGNWQPLTIHILDNVTGLTATYDNYQLTLSWTARQVETDDYIYELKLTNLDTNQDVTPSQNTVTGANSITLPVTDAWAGQKYKAQLRATSENPILQGNWADLIFHIPPNATALQLSYSDLQLRATWHDSNVDEAHNPEYSTYDPETDTYTNYQPPYTYSARLEDADETLVGEEMVHGVTAVYTTTLTPAQAGQTYTLKLRITQDNIDGNVISQPIQIPPNITNIQTSYQQNATQDLIITWDDLNPTPPEGETPSTPPYTYTLKLVNNTGDIVGNLQTGLTEAQIALHPEHLSAGQYAVWIRAVNQAGVNGNWQISNFTVPTQVSNVVVQYQEPALIINWKDLNILGSGTNIHLYTYDFYVVTEVGDPVGAPQIGLTEVTAQVPITDNEIGKPLTIYIRAVADGIRGDWLPTTTQIPANIPQLTVSREYKNSTFTAQWSAGANNGQYDYILRDAQGMVAMPPQTISQNQLQTQVELTNEYTYTFSVRANVNGMVGNWTHQTFTMPQRITGLTLTYSGQTLQANWNALTQQNISYSLIILNGEQLVTQQQGLINNTFHYTVPNPGVHQTLTVILFGVLASIEGNSTIGNLTISSLDEQAQTFFLNGVNIVQAGLTLQQMYPLASATDFAMALATAYQLDDPNTGLDPLLITLRQLGFSATEAGPAIRTVYPNLTSAQWGNAIMLVYSPTPPQFAGQLAWAGYTLEESAQLTADRFGQMEVVTFAKDMQQAFSLNNPATDTTPLAKALAKVGYVVTDTSKALTAVFPTLTPQQLGNALTIAYSQSLNDFIAQLVNSGASLDQATEAIASNYPSLTATQIALLLKDPYDLNDPDTDGGPLTHALAGAGFPPTDISPALMAVFPTMTSTQLGNALTEGYS